MIRLEIVDGSLQISTGGSIILVAPKDSCAIDVLSLYEATPRIFIYNKYLGTSTSIFNNPLSNCEDSKGTPFTVSSFIAFAEANLGFNILKNAISGTGANGQVAFFNGINTQSGDDGLFWDNTNKRLGIGTTTPGAKLDVNGNIRSSNQFSNLLGLVLSTVSNRAQLYQPLGVSLAYWKDSSIVDGLVLTNSGNVGIGTIAPGAKLDVRAQGALATDIAFRVRNSTDTQNFLVVNGAGDVYNNGANGGDTNTHFGVNTARNRTGAYNSTFGNEAGRDLTTGVNNALFGYNAGRNITTQSGNTFIGTSAGQSNISNNNTAVGTNVLVLNTTGFSNTAIGNEALYHNTTAFFNTALGNGAGINNTTGGRNTFLGSLSGRGNTTGQSNICIGVDSAFAQTTGNNNIFVGDVSGMFLADGVANLTISNNSLFLGRDTRANADNQTNQIVIGDSAIGLGSNSVVLGNDSIVTTALKGNVLIGTTTTVASSKLTVESTTQGFLPPRMTNAQRLAIASPAVGLCVYCTDATEGLYINKSTGWTFII